MLRQRHLNEDAVNLRILVERMNNGEELALRCRVREPGRRAVHPGFIARPALRSNIDRTRRIFPDKHDRKSGANATRSGEVRHLVCYFVANLAGNRYAIDQISGQSPPRVSRG